MIHHILVATSISIIIFLLHITFAFSVDYGDGKVIYESVFGHFYQLGAWVEAWPFLIAVLVIVLSSMNVLVSFRQRWSIALVPMLLAFALSWGTYASTAYWMDGSIGFEAIAQGLYRIDLVTFAIFYGIVLSLVLLGLGIRAVINLEG